MLTVAIPTYEYKGHGVEVLEFSFTRLAYQTFKDFDVVITDHSIDREIEYLCDKWLDRLDIKYFRNEKDRGSASSNTAYSISKSSGELIKLLCQDDYLYDENALQATINNFDKSTNWLASAYMHTHNKKDLFNYHYPVWNDKIYLSNTLGTPSCITIRNDLDLPEIDKSLTYCYDCDLYYKLYKKYGLPKIIDPVTVVNYLWDQSVTSRTTQETITIEQEIMRYKYS